MKSLLSAMRKLSSLYPNVHFKTVSTCAAQIGMKPPISVKTMIEKINPALTTIKVEITSKVLLPGHGTDPKATALDQYSIPMAGVNISWANSNSAVGSLKILWDITNVQGLTLAQFTAIAAGTTKISATNGGVSGSENITVIPDAPADLAFIRTGQDPEKFSFSPGEPFAVYFSFLNNGGTPTGEFSIRLILLNRDTNVIIDVKDVTAPSYPPGAGNYVYWTFSQGLPKGEYIIDAYLDFKNEVVEVSKTNNTISHPIVVGF